jgi:hypothetical protein
MFNEFFYQKGERKRRKEKKKKKEREKTKIGILYSYFFKNNTIFQNLQFILYI